MDNTLQIKKTALWLTTYSLCREVKYVIEQGGAQAGKTYTILDVLLYRMCTEKGLVITVTGPNFPSLKRGPMRDIQSIWSNDPLYKKMITQPNQNGCRCDATGSVLEFCVFYNIEVAKGAKRDILFINEVTAMPETIAFELFARTRKNVIVDFNPTNRFWIHERFEGDNKNARWVFSTHKANRFLLESVHEEIESWKESNPERYKVYGLGMCGKTEGCIYTNWCQVDAMPDEYKWRAFGLDWGFMNDSTALVEVRYSGGELYLKEHIYKTGMTNQDIVCEIQRLGFQNELIVADSAEMKSIEELRRAGILNVIPAHKGPGSILQGISLVQSLKLNVTKDSINIKNELLNYKWDTDALGYFSNKPIDKFNHAADCIRYCVSYKFERPGKMKTTLNSF